MSKENISATVDKDVAEYLDQPGRNRSETINMAVKAYMDSAGGEKAMIKLRLNQLRSRRKSLNSELENVVEEIEQLEGRLDTLEQEKQSERQDTWEEALNIIQFGEFKSTGDVYIRSDESTVKDFADRLDMDVEAFRSELIERNKEQ